MPTIKNLGKNPHGNFGPNMITKQNYLTSSSGSFNKAAMKAGMVGNSSHHQVAASQAMMPKLNMSTGLHAGRGAPSKDISVPQLPGLQPRDNRMRTDQPFEYPNLNNSQQQQPSMSHRTHQSTFREENVPITERSPIKSARYGVPQMMMAGLDTKQPQMNPSLKNPASIRMVDVAPYHGHGQQQPTINDYGLHRREYQDDGDPHDMQIKFQGDMGDDMQPPNTDDEEESISNNNEPDDAIPYGGQPAQKFQSQYPRREDHKEYGYSPAIDSYQNHQNRYPDPVVSGYEGDNDPLSSSPVLLNVHGKKPISQSQEREDSGRRRRKRVNNQEASQPHFLGVNRLDFHQANPISASTQILQNPNLQENQSSSNQLPQLTQLMHQSQIVDIQVRPKPSQIPPTSSGINEKKSQIIQINEEMN